MIQRSPFDGAAKKLPSSTIMNQAIKDGTPVDSTTRLTVPTINLRAFSNIGRTISPSAHPLPDQPHRRVFGRNTTPGFSCPSFPSTGLGDSFSERFSWVPWTTGLPMSSGLKSRPWALVRSYYFFSSWSNEASPCERADQPSFAGTGNACRSTWQLLTYSSNPSASFSRFFELLSSESRHVHCSTP